MNRSLEPLALLIKKAQFRQNRQMEEKVNQVGITLVQWNALREIDRNPSCSMHFLAELTFNSDQAFGKLVARLLRSGLVQRQSGAGRALVQQEVQVDDARAFGRRVRSANPAHALLNLQQPVQEG